MQSQQSPSAHVCTVQRKRSNCAPRATNKVEQHLNRWPANIGTIESLAGINPQSNAERHELWAKHQDKFTLPDLVALRAVMAECKATAALRLGRGEFSLFPRQEGGSA